MKFGKLYLLIIFMILAGCYGPARFAIPDEPKFKQFGVYQFEGGLCMEPEDIAILQENLGLMKKYQDELRRILTDIQAGRR